MNTRNYSRREIVESVPQKGFFGHPKGLSTLFFTEFWGAIQLLWYESDSSLLSVLFS